MVRSGGIILFLKWHFCPGREPPAVELYPEATQTVVAGGSVLLQCRVTAGIPLPRVTWTRDDGRPLSPAIEELPGGVLR